MDNTTLNFDKMQAALKISDDLHSKFKNNEINQDEFNNEFVKFIMEDPMNGIYLQIRDDIMIKLHKQLSKNK